MSCPLCELQASIADNGINVNGYNIYECSSMENHKFVFVDNPPNIVESCKCCESTSLIEYGQSDLLFCKNCIIFNYIRYDNLILHQEAQSYLNRIREQRTRIKELFNHNFIIMLWTSILPIDNMIDQKLALLADWCRQNEFDVRMISIQNFQDYAIFLDANVIIKFYFEEDNIPRAFLKRDKILSSLKLFVHKDLEEQFKHNYRDLKDLNIEYYVSDDINTCSLLENMTNKITNEILDASLPR